MHPLMLEGRPMSAAVGQGCGSCVTMCVHEHMCLRTRWSARVCGWREEGSSSGKSRDS